MSAVLELLPIEGETAEQAVAKTEVAVAASSALDLSKLDLTDVALAQFGDWRKEVATVEKTLTGVVHDVSTQAKIDEAKSLRHRLIGKPRAEARKVSAELKSKLAKVSKAIGKEEETAVLEWDRVEGLISPAIEKGETEIAAKKQREIDRKATHQAGIDKIRSYAEMAKGLPSDRVAGGIALLEAMTFGAEWEEFAVEAANAQCQTIEALRVLLAVAQAKERAEAEAKRQAEVQHVLSSLTWHVTQSFGKPASHVQEIIDLLNSTVYSESLGVEVLTAHDAAIKQLQTLHAMAVQQEAQAAALAAQQAQVTAPAVEPTAPKNGNLQEPAADTPVPSTPSSEAINADDPRQIPGHLADTIVHCEPVAPYSSAALETTEADAIEPAPGTVNVQPVDEITVLLRDALTLVEFLRGPLTGKFPSQPRVGTAWWINLRERLDAIEPRLQYAVGIPAGEA